MRLFSVAVLLTLLAAAFLFLGCSVSAEEGGKTTIDLLAMLQKVPAFIPLFVAKVQTQACKDNLVVFKDDLDKVLAKVGKSKKPLMTDLKSSVCKVPRTCTAELLGELKKMAKSGGFIERMAKTALEQKGLDIETADIMILAYIENLCSNDDESEEDLAARLEEL